MCPQWADSFEDCLQDPAELPIFQRSREESTGVFCWGALGLYMWGSYPCEDPIWNCTTTGPCDGYEKSERLCTAKLHREAYPCFFDPDNVAAGIKKERYTYSIWVGLFCFFLIGLSSICSCFLAFFVRKAFYRNFNSIFDFIHQFSPRTCLCGSTARLVYLLVASVFLIVSIEILLFLFVLPGQSYYSLWGAPQLAVSKSVQFSDVRGNEAPVPFGFNQPSFGAEVLRVFILVLQIYLAIGVMVFCLWAGFKWYRSTGSVSDRYQRVP
eukprot:Skav203531  [mRNA]  locus=scaffold687:460507:461610:- [translate_table: standard]